MKQALPKNRILILSSAETDETMSINNNFVDKLNKSLDGHSLLEWHNYHDIELDLSPNNHTLRIISNGNEITDYAAVYFKSYFRYHEQAKAIVEILMAKNIKFVGHELEHNIAFTKLTQLARLSVAGLSFPHTIYRPTEHYIACYSGLKDKLGSEFIFKAIDGATGRDNYLIKSLKQLSTIVKENPDMLFIAQEMIPNEADLRVLIIDNEIKLVIERKRKDNTTHLNNTSQGANARLLPVESLSSDERKLSIDAAKAMGRDIAGVDLMFNKDTGAPYILEVNASPQIGSGAFEDEKLQIYREFFEKLSRSSQS